MVDDAAHQRRGQGREVRAAGAGPRRARELSPVPLPDRPVTGEFETVLDLFDAVLEVAGDVEAFVDGDRRVTFAEWARAADGVATRLAAMGVGVGDVVGISLPSSIDYAVAYQAALRLGAVTSGMNPRLGVAETAHILGQDRPTGGGGRAAGRGSDHPAAGRAGRGRRRGALRRPAATAGHRPGRHRVDQRHDRTPEGGGVRPRVPPRHGRGGRAALRGGRPAALAAPVRPRRLHDPGLGRAGARDHHDHHPEPLDRRRRRAPHRRRAGHGRAGRARPVADDAEPPRAGRHRHLEPPDRQHRRGAGAPGAGRGPARGVRLPGRGPLHEHRGLRLDRHVARRSRRGHRAARSASRARASSWSCAPTRAAGRSSSRATSGPSACGAGP